MVGDVVPLQGAVVVCYGGGGGDDQLWGSGRGCFDNTKIGFCYLGSMLVFSSEIKEQIKEE